MHQKKIKSSPKAVAFWMWWSAAAKFHLPSDCHHTMPIRIWFATGSKNGEWQKTLKNLIFRRWSLLELPLILCFRGRAKERRESRIRKEEKEKEEEEERITTNSSSQPICTMATKIGQRLQTAGCAGRAYWHTRINKHSKTQAYTHRHWCVNKLDRG
jgi:hypothetical protein